MQFLSVFCNPTRAARSSPNAPRSNPKTFQIELNQNGNLGKVIAHLGVFVARLGAIMAQLARTSRPTSPISWASRPKFRQKLQPNRAIIPPSPPRVPRSLQSSIFLSFPPGVFQFSPNKGGTTGVGFLLTLYRITFVDQDFPSSGYLSQGT